MDPYSFVMSSLDKEQINSFRSYFHSLSRPRHISPMKRVKWRLVKKWFNRFEKERILGVIVFAQASDGSSIPCMITDVKIEKGGRHLMNYNIAAIPITQCRHLKI